MNISESSKRDELVARLRDSGVLAEKRKVNFVHVRKIDVDGTVLSDDIVTNTVTAGWSATMAYLAQNGARPTTPTGVPAYIGMTNYGGVTPITTYVTQNNNFGTGNGEVNYSGATTNTASGGTLTCTATITATAALTVVNLLLYSATPSNTAPVCAISAYSASLTTGQQLAVSWALNF